MKRTVTTEAIEIKANKIDITDPCYDKDTWCRMKKPITPGMYVGKAEISDETNGWGERVLNLSIIKEGVSEDRIKYSGRAIGSIGVDAGLAGFFVDKPDYTEDTAWNKFCNWLFDNERDNKQEKIHVCTEDSPAGCVGCFTSSGYGDGGYPVYKLTNRQTGEHIGYSIIFIR